MKIAKRATAVLLALVMMMSLFAVNGFAATITKIEIVELPAQTTFYRGTDWDYGYWQFPEGDGLGTFVSRDNIVTFMHRGGYFSRYQDRGMLDMNGLVVKVTYSNGTSKKVSYKETLNSNGVVSQNIYFSPTGGDFKVGENTIEIYFPENFNVYTTYKINILEMLKGDVDGNGKVNSSDALKVLQHSVQLVILTAEQQKAADMNADNKVNSIDALKILQKSVGMA